MSCPFANASTRLVGTRAASHSPIVVVARTVAAWALAGIDTEVRIASTVSGATEYNPTIREDRPKLNAISMR